MHPVLQHLINTEFSDLSGSRIEGQLALSDDLINLGIHDLVAKLTGPDSPTDTAPPIAIGDPPLDSDAPASQLPDPKLLLRKLKIDQLNYRTETGKTILEVKAGLE